MSLKTYHVTIVTRREWHGIVPAFSSAHACEIAFDFWHNGKAHSFRAGPVECTDIDAQEVTA